MIELITSNWEYFLLALYVLEKGIKLILKDFNYWKRAEKFNNPYSLYNLGRMYLNGEFVLKNEEKAYEYTRKAVNLNYAHAYTNLGYMYDAGIFLKKDFISK